METDIVVIINELLSLHPSANVWISLAMGKHFQLTVLMPSASLGPETSRTAMPLFLSLIGCDTTSCFMGRGKKSAWEAWKSYREVTDAFLYLADNPYYHWDTEDPTSSCLSVFNMILYEKASNETSVNEARTLENIPPTQVNVIIRYF